MKRIVIGGWQKKISRLTQMSWDEIRTRLGQEYGKRRDLARYLTGPRQFAVAFVEKPSRAAHFFFDRSQLSDRTELLRNHLPRQVEKNLSEAESILHHEFHLLGYEKLNHGTNIDWHLDAVHGKRAPLKPWFKINFLDFETVGDHKVIWEINRHQHLVTLAKAWCFTHDRRFSDELVAQWFDWQKSNPYPLGINWASTLEVAFRSLSWLWMRELLKDCDSLPPGFATRLLHGLHSHGRYIERYLSTYFSPNTHLLGEALALFFLGTMCPELPDAERWQQSGWKIVLDEAQRQVRSDGVYFEQALYYHVYALDFFLHARILAGLNGIGVPPQFDDVLRKMLDVVDALSQTGIAEGFGDDDGGRLFNPRRNRVEHMTDPLAIGAACYGENYLAASLTEESVWLFGEKAVAALATPGGKPSLRSRAFEAGGIYLIADGGPPPQQMMIDGGPQGIGRSGHGHADALSIRFSVGGQRVLIDPGSGVYICANGDRDLFRGTASHNTVQVDGLDQAVPEGPFAWSSIPKVQVDRWITGETFDFFTATHDGYGRLDDPVTHQRTVFHVKDGFWFIRDIVAGRQVHFLQSWWHFAPSVLVKKENKRITAMLPELSQTGLQLVMLTTGDSPWETAVTQGTVSPAYGAKQTAAVVNFSVTVPLPAEHVIAFVSQESSELSRFEEVQIPGHDGVRGYRLDGTKRTRYVFFGQSEKWHCGPWASDARVLYCEIADGRLNHLIMISGSFAKWQNKEVYVHPTSVERFEWVNRRGRAEIFSSDPGAAGQQVESNFEFFNFVV